MTLDPAGSIPLPATGEPAWKRDRHVTRLPLVADTSADVAIVGAGIAGLTTALLLGLQGIDVVVLEGLKVGAGTTGRTTAKVSALQGTRLQEIRSAHGDDVARAYATAQVDAVERIGRFVADHRIECDWEERTAATIALEPAHRDLVDEEAAAARVAGLDVDVVDRCDELPFAVAGAVLLAAQRQFDPQRYVDGLAAAAEATGHVRIHEASRVVSIDGRGDLGVTIGSGVRVRAGDVVVATLLDIVDRGLHFATAEPVASYCIAVEVGGPLPEGMYLSAGGTTRSLRTMSDGVGSRLLVVGGEGHRVGTSVPTSARFDALARWTAERFPVKAIRHRWFAHDQSAADHLPWAGPVGRATPHLFSVGGFGKWGMTNATAAAQVLAAAITGTPTPGWAPVFAPHRPSRAGASGSVRHNVTTAKELAKGWLDPRREKVVCTHLGGICTRNDAESTWDCPLHGSRFDEDGTVVAGPAVRPLRRSSVT